MFGIVIKAQKLQSVFSLAVPSFSVKDDYLAIFYVLKIFLLLVIDFETFRKLLVRTN